MGLNEQLLEQVLILRCQIGDKNAFQELIEKYQLPLRYFINRLLENSKAKEDVFQETWLIVIEKIHTLKEPDAFSTWLYRIARNYVYQELKKSKKLIELQEDIPAPADEENNISFSDDVARIHRCLEKLHPLHREVLMLRFLHGMSYEKISQVINCKLGTVKSRISYAKSALKKEMEE
jgi:RNA polymerase sigma-70 factor (ECF subfamily)